MDKVSGLWIMGEGRERRDSPAFGDTAPRLSSAFPWPSTPSFTLRCNGPLAWEVSFLRVDGQSIWRQGPCLGGDLMEDGGWKKEAQGELQINR